MAEEKIKLLLVTGCSGAGKTTVASVAESLGYYIVEQIPFALAESLIDVFKNDPQTYGKVALFVNLGPVSALPVTSTQCSLVA